MNRATNRSFNLFYIKLGSKTKNLTEFFPNYYCLYSQEFHIYFIYVHLCINDIYNKIRSYPPTIFL